MVVEVLDLIGVLLLELLVLSPQSLHFGGYFVQPAVQAHQLFVQFFLLLLTLSDFGDGIPDFLLFLLNNIYGLLIVVGDELHELDVFCLGEAEGLRGQKSGQLGDVGDGGVEFADAGVADLEVSALGVGLHQVDRL